MSGITSIPVFSSGPVKLTPAAQGVTGAGTAAPGAAAGGTPALTLSLSPDALAGLKGFDPAEMEARMAEHAAWRQKNVAYIGGLRQAVAGALGADSDHFGFGASGAGGAVLRGIGAGAGLTDPGRPPGAESTPDAITKAGLGTFDIGFSGGGQAPGHMRIYFDAKEDLASADRVVDLSSGSDEAKGLLARFQGSTMGAFAAADTGKDMMGLGKAYAVLGTGADGSSTLLGVAFTNTKGDYLTDKGTDLFKTFAKAIAAA